MCRVGNWQRTIQGSKLQLLLLCLLLLSYGCIRVENSPPPTPPGTVPEIIEVLCHGGDLARVQAAYAVVEMSGEDDTQIMPALIENLQYDGAYDVRMASAVALGAMGSSARPAIPALIAVLRDEDEFYKVRRTAARALAAIGDSAAVPALASVLYENSLAETTSRSFVMTNSAEALEILTGEQFGGRSGPYGYMVGENDIPLIIFNAREWWEEVGQHMNWPDVPAIAPTNC